MWLIIYIYSLIPSQRDDSAYVVKAEDKIGQPNDTSQVNATCTSSDEAIPTGI